MFGNSYPGQWSNNTSGAVHWLPTQSWSQWLSDNCFQSPEPSFAQCVRYDPVLLSYVNGSYSGNNTLDYPQRIPQFVDLCQNLQEYQLTLNSRCSEVQNNYQSTDWQCNSGESQRFNLSPDRMVDVENDFRYPNTDDSFSNVFPEEGMHHSNQQCVEPYQVNRGALEYFHDYSVDTSTPTSTNEISETEQRHQAALKQCYTNFYLNSQAQEIYQSESCTNCPDMESSYRSAEWKPFSPQKYVLPPSPMPQASTMIDSGIDQGYIDDDSNLNMLADEVANRSSLEYFSPPNNEKETEDENMEDISPEKIIDELTIEKRGKAAAHRRQLIGFTKALNDELPYAVCQNGRTPRLTTLQKAAEYIELLQECIALAKQKKATRSSCAVSADPVQMTVERASEEPSNSRMIQCFPSDTNSMDKEKTSENGEIEAKSEDTTSSNNRLQNITVENCCNVLKSLINSYENGEVSSKDADVFESTNANMENQAQDLMKECWKNVDLYQGENKEDRKSSQEDKKSSQEKKEVTKRAMASEAAAKKRSVRAKRSRKVYPCRRRLKPSLSSEPTDCELVQNSESPKMDTSSSTCSKNKLRVTKQALSTFIDLNVTGITTLTQ